MAEQDCFPAVFTALDIFLPKVVVGVVQTYKIDHLLYRDGGMLTSDQSGATDKPRPSARTYKRHIRWYDGPHHYTILQIYKKGIEFALVSDKYEQCHQFVWCKDFLHDVIYSAVNNAGFLIYRFNYSPFNDPRPCLKELRLLVSNAKDNRLRKLLPACLDFLHQIEDRLGIPHTTIREVANPEPDRSKAGVFLFRGHRRWLHSAPMLSLYMLLLRVGLSHTAGKPFTETIQGLKDKLIKPYQPRDPQWLIDSESAFHKILRIGDKRIFYRDIKNNYPPNLIIDQVHNCFGILGFANDMLKHKLRKPVPVPYWHRHR